MDNGEFCSLDFSFIARELNSALRGGVVRGVYQYGKKQLVLEVFVHGKGEFKVYADSRRIFLAGERKDAPEEPPNFCMLLRKYLMNRPVEEIRQHGFDRVVEIETDENILIFEFLPPGNIVLCDKLYNIIMPMEMQRFKHREIRPKESYLFPPSQQDVFRLEIFDFFKLVSEFDGSTEESVADIGFGKTYAVEACRRAGINPEKPASKVTVDEATVLFKTVKEMSETRIEACVYQDFVSAFPLVSRKASYKPAATLSGAIESIISKIVSYDEKRAAEEAAGREEERVERIEESREAAKEMLSAKKEEKSASAQLIYKHYDIVSNVLEGINRARNNGMGWQEIKERVLLINSREAKAIKEIRESEAKIILNLEGVDVEVDMRKTPEENAGIMFQGVKKIRKKIERIENLPKPEPKHVSVEEIQMSITGKKLRGKPAPKKARPKKGKRWYETYRWFVSSDGNVVVAGKSALQNDSIIKSRFKENDAAFHADIHGAAFVIAKADDEGQIGPLTIKEAAEFAAAHSKAWASGFTEVDVNQFRFGQLSKTAPDGAKLPRGSFHSSGKSGIHEKVDVKLSIGVDVREPGNAKVVAGPLMPVRKSCKYFVTIQPGNVEGSELGQKVKNAILAKCLPDHRRAIDSLPLDEFSRHIPSGSGSLVS